MTPLLYPFGALAEQIVTASFQTTTIDRNQAGALKNALWDIHTGALDLLIVRGVLSAASCARAVARLEDPNARFDWTLQEHRDPKKPQFTLLGESLTPYQGHPQGPKLEHYFEQAAMFRSVCRTLFEGGPDYETTVESTFGELSGGRAIDLPPRYTPATIRMLPPGCEIPLHVGNYFLETPAYSDLATRVDLEDQLSYFIPLQNPEGGGELVVYRLEWGEQAPEQTREGRGGFDDLAAEPWPCERFSPGVGDLLLFNGGRFYHRVTRVTGRSPRWTIGGFLSFSPDGTRVLYWS